MSSELDRGQPKRTFEHLGVERWIASERAPDYSDQRASVSTPNPDAASTKNAMLFPLHGSFA